MIDNIHFLIPNLERRTDRWKFCHDSLVKRGVPIEHITRFIAFDGLDYLDANKDHSNLSLLKGKVAELLDGDLPPFIANTYERNNLTHHAWNCTWYFGLSEIARHTDFVCWLVDDHVLQVDYNDLLADVNILNDTAKKDRTAFHAVQLFFNFLDPIVFEGQAVYACPHFQYGYGSRDDAAVIYSPQGAQWALDYGNQRAEIAYTDCYIVSADILHSKPPGFFGVTEKNTLVSMCTIPRLRYAVPHRKYTDRGISRRELKEEL